MKRPEQDLHRSILGYVRAAYPRAVVFHVPNGGKRSVREARVFKGLGVRAGVADLCLHWREGRTGYLEIKAGRGRLSEGQIVFAQDCEAVGISWACVRSLDEAVGVLKRWGVQ